jgi:hypothetical protein
MHIESRLISLLNTRPLPALFDGIDLVLKVAEISCLVSGGKYSALMLLGAAFVYVLCPEIIANFITGSRICVVPTLSPAVFLAMMAVLPSLVHSQKERVEKNRLILPLLFLLACPGRILFLLGLSSNEALTKHMTKIHRASAWAGIFWLCKILIYISLTHAFRRGGPLLFVVITSLIYPVLVLSSLADSALPVIVMVPLVGLGAGALHICPGPRGTKRKEAKAPSERAKERARKSRASEEKSPKKEAPKREEKSPRREEKSGKEEKRTSSRSRRQKKAEVAKQEEEKAPRPRRAAALAAVESTKALETPRKKGQPPK